MLAAPLAAQPVEAGLEYADVEFDSQMLRSRGVDGKVADWFRKAPRFTEGVTTVRLTVNGTEMGKARARFDAHGRLCPDRTLLRHANLIVPSDMTDNNAQTCYDLKQAWPQAEIVLDPSQERVSIVVPPDAVVTHADSGRWDHGGVAGMLNYDAQYMDSAGLQANVGFVQLGTEAGLNAGDWVLRSRQTFTRFNGANRFTHAAAYAQRSFAEQKTVVQVGQISLSNPMFGVGQVLGVQVMPESALQNRGSGALVEGVADMQSVVEVRQSGALVYSTTVPAGPFRLQNFPLINSRSDLDVTVTGSDGQKRQFVVPATAFLVNGGFVSPGWSFGAGKLEQEGGVDTPWVATAANGWSIGPRATLGAGVLASSQYQAVAVELDSQPFDGTSLSLQVTSANDRRNGNRGVSLSASLNHLLTERAWFNVNATQQTPGYRELSDTLRSDADGAIDLTRNQIGGGLGWSHETIGALTLAWSTSTTFRGSNAQYLRASWSRQFNRISVGLNLDRSSGGAQPTDNRLYLTVNIPLGTQGSSVNGWLNSRKDSVRTGARYNGRASQDRNWSVSAEHDTGTGRTSATGMVDIVTPVGQLAGGLVQDTTGYTSWSARATGGMLTHGGGVTISPYRITDTFGIAKVGDEAGVRLETPGGPTWTDRRGYAVLPALNAYRTQAIQVDTRSLSKHVDIANAWHEAQPARGAVSYLNFDVVSTRRVLVDARNADGARLPSGAGVFSSGDHFITVTSSDGTLFVPDAHPGMQLEVQSPDLSSCRLTLDIPAKPDRNGPYETTSATCT
ncbi:fimbrial protein [Burkholderia pyrrocinia]|nr:fimbrial protein [Burkholderia pyrrocinia]